MISRARRVLRRLQEIPAEIDYAQQRMFEIRTGVPLTAQATRARARAEIKELESLYELTLRIASPADAVGLARLAELDEAPPLTGPVLLAEVGGSLRAAIALSDLRTIADPFEPTAALAQLLTVRRRQLQETERARRPLARLARLRALLPS